MKVCRRQDQASHPRRGAAAAENGSGLHRGHTEATVTAECWGQLRGSPAQLSCMDTQGVPARRCKAETRPGGGGRPEATQRELILRGPRAHEDSRDGAVSRACAHHTRGRGARAGTAAAGCPPRGRPLVLLVPKEKTLFRTNDDRRGGNSDRAAAAVSRNRTMEETLPEPWVAAGRWHSQVGRWWPRWPHTRTAPQGGQGACRLSQCGRPPSGTCDTALSPAPPEGGPPSTLSQLSHGVWLHRPQPRTG